MHQVIEMAYKFRDDDGVRILTDYEKLEELMPKEQDKIDVHFGEEVLFCFQELERSMPLPKKRSIPFGDLKDSVLFLNLGG